MNQDTFPGRLALQQRVIPAYRQPFFDLLAQACQGGLGIFAGQPLPGENITPGVDFKHARLFPAENKQLFAPDSPYYLLWQTVLLDWLENYQPDALIVEANSRYLATPYAIRWMHAHQHPVLGWGLGAPPISGALTSLRRVQRERFLRSLDGLIAYSQRGAGEYRNLGIPPERVFIAPNAVAPRPEKPPPVRSEIYELAPIVLFVGRLQPRKRVDLLIKACAGLPEVLRPRLWVVGDGPARQEWEALAHAIYPQAEFLGEQRGAELDHLFDKADLFVLPGTGGLAVQQAMAHALPVIVAEGDGSQADLVRPENGWQVAPGNLADLEGALQQALKDPLQLRKKGLASFQIVSSEINLDSMVQGFIRALNQVMRA